MAESFSVKAVLSAVDRGFTSTIKNALNSVGALGKSVAFGMLQGAGMAAFNALSSGVSGLVSEIDNANATWKTFDANMKIVGKGEDEINAVKNALQKYAETTVYSSSDMAATYSQLAAVGVKSADKLVTGFGGLAAAAENPQQAMKTLSQQATQMAAKPSVQWADFKLMLEQTPAGIAAVAKQMGMSTSELVTAVQEGSVKTSTFFKAIEEAGNSDAFYKLATEAKTVGQAMDGLKETLGNKLTPAFDVLSKIGIKAVDGIANKFAKLDGQAIATKLSGWIAKVKPYWDSFAKAIGRIGLIISKLGKKVAPIFNKIKETAGGAITSMLDKINAIDVNKVVNTVCGWAQKAKPYFDLIKDAVAKVASAFAAAWPYIKQFATALGSFLLNNSEQICNTIRKLTPLVLGAVAAFKGFKIIHSVAPGMSKFAGSIASMASGGIKGLATKLFGVAAGQTATGTAAKASNKQILTAAKAFLMMGAGVLMIAGSLALLAQSAIALANSGGLAIGVMVGLTVGLVALGAGMVLVLKTLAPMGKKLAPVATAMLAMGAAVLLVSAGFALLSFSAISLANAGGLAIGVMVGMVATVALLAVGAAALAPALTAGAVGLIAFGAAIVLVGVGAVLAAASLAIISAILPAIAAHGTAGATAIVSLGAAMIVFAAGAALCGAACVVLAAGLVAVAAGVTLAGAGVMVLATGVLMLAAGAVVLGAGLSICAAAITLLAAVLPVAATGAMLVVAAFAGLLAVSGGLAAMLIAVNAPMIVIGASALVAAAGMLAFGVAMLTGAAGTVAMSAALKGVKSQMKSIASSAKKAESSLDDMRSTVKVVESGLDALGSKAKNAMQKVTSAFDSTANKAKTAGQKVGQGFTQGMQSGLNQAPVVARATTAQVAVTLSSGYGSAYSAGAYISAGFAAGMSSCLGQIRAAAAAMAAAADEAIRAKAKIHSPSKVTTNLGEYFGEGFVNGIAEKTRDAWAAAENLVSIPAVATPNLAMAYGGEMSSDYSYYRDYSAVIEVPLAVDGKEFARATASYTQTELDKKQARESRKHGKV